MEETLKNDLETYFNESLVVSDGDELLIKLAEKIQWLIDHDLNTLYNTLYRIDVKEEMIKKIVSENKYDLHAILIAKAIIERQTRKIETRKKYS